MLSFFGFQGHVSTLSAGMQEIAQRHQVESVLPVELVRSEIASNGLYGIPISGVRISRRDGGCQVFTGVRFLILYPCPFLIYWIHIGVFLDFGFLSSSFRDSGVRLFHKCPGILI